MTVAALPSIKSYNGNGVTTAFATTFQFQMAADLEVRTRTAQGIETLLAIGVDYDVTGGNGATGMVTCATAPGIGIVVEIKRGTARVQAMDYTPGDRFPAESHEKTLDKLMMISQEQDDLIAELDAGEFLGDLDAAQLARQRSEEAKVAAEDARTDALAYRDDASDFRDAAESEADRAELAGSSAATNGKLYPTTAAGIAATVNGDYFLVAGAGERFAMLYKNVAGVAVSQGLAMPSTAAVSYAVVGPPSTDSTMEGPNNWANQVGTPIQGVGPSFGGELELGFAGLENRSAELPGVMVVDDWYEVSIDLTRTSGAACPITLGRFASGNGAGIYKITPTAVKTRYTFLIKAQDAYFAIGTVAAEALACVVRVDNLLLVRLGAEGKLLRDRIAALATGGTGNFPIAYATDQFMQSIARSDKALTRICIAGDSLVANDTGGAVPPGVSEGANAYPIRLDCNNIARQLYDRLSWNKAVHRQVAHVAWTKSGTWSAVNDATIWEPPHALSNYHQCSTASGYIEITVPAGMENFALICQRDEGFGTLTVTLNGGSIAAYGPSLIDLARARANASDNGNPYHTVEYLGLPAGTNVIRVAKAANTTPVRVWGGFWWSGNTLMIYNVGHGNHQMAALIDQGHLQAEVIENDFDAILFELPIMNEVGTAPVKTVAQSQANLASILDALAGKDMMFWSPWPFGTDPVDGTPNYYTLYSNPTMEATAAGLVATLNSRGVAYLDIFRVFKQKVENRGGTLVGGEAGLWFSTDGQHPTPLTNGLVTDMVMSVLSTKPVMAP